MELKSFKLTNSHNSPTDITLQIDKNLFFQLPKEIAHKVLVISVIYLQKGNIRFKHNKLMAIYKNYSNLVWTCPAICIPG